MKIVLQIITYWVLLFGCVVIPYLTWAYLRAERRARRDEAARAALWLGSAELNPPS